ncbi:MAG: LysM peptidoglycan-binding domain-containing protein [Campylobacterales bacterium]|nr:LysM peptidoglycan-binding domain-containing protein [Campylobacterales bacterium]
MTKTLPVPSEQMHTKVIPIEEMIEKYVRIEEPLRFKGTLISEEINATLIQKDETKQEKFELKYGEYTIVEGDTLNNIADKFELTSKDISSLNQFTDRNVIQVGQKIRLPFSQTMIDSIVNAEYQIEEGDTLISVANKFHLSPKDLSRINSIKTTASIKTGRILKLPLPYVMAALEAKRKKEEAVQKPKEEKIIKEKTIREFGTHQLRVTATAYTSHASQTDKSPFIAAWGNRISPGMKIIAVSRDLLYRYGLSYGSQVKIGGLPGLYKVADKMNPRFRQRIDIYMGIDRGRALRWGRRSVVLHW